MRVVAVGERLDKFVGAGKTTYAFDFCVRRGGVAPADVFFYRAGKQHVLLQHHGYRIAKRDQVIISDVFVADKKPAFAHVVQARDKLHKAAFAGTRAAENTHRFA